MNNINETQDKLTKIKEVAEIFSKAKNELLRSDEEVILSLNEFNISATDLTIAASYVRDIATNYQNYLNAGNVDILQSEE
jgi:hypothetical protein